MKTKWYNNFNLNLIVVLILSIFNFLMMFFAGGYIDMMWKISQTTSEILALGFVILYGLNIVLLLKNIIKK